MSHRIHIILRLVAAAAIVGLLGILGSTARATDLTGCWEGEWVSSTSGHEGPLQATFTRRNAKQYDVVFRGLCFKIFPFRYSVTLDVVCDNGCEVVLAGSSDLKLFGTFRYRAEADHCDFVADYTSCDDDGQFILHRVCCQRENRLRTSR